jgi:hypothetical protein
VWRRKRVLHYKRVAKEELSNDFVAYVALLEVDGLDCITSSVGRYNAKCARVAPRHGDTQNIAE